MAQASSHKVNSDIFTFNLNICLLQDMIEMTWPLATAHVSWQFIGNNICDKWSYFTSEILSVLLKYSPRRRRDGDEPRLFPGVGSRSLDTPYPGSPPMLMVRSDMYAMIDNVWNQKWNTRILGEGAIQSIKRWKLNVSIGGDNLFRRAFFTSSPRIALSNLHSQHRHTSRTCLAGRGRPSTNQTDQGFVCHRDASGGNRTAFIIRKTGDVIWIQPWCKLSLLVIEMRRRSCCWLRRWRMPLVTTSDRPLSTCWLPPHLLSWVIILKE